MKHEGQAICLVNFDKSLNVKLWRMHIMSVKIADSDGQSIYSSCFDETLRLLDIREDIGCIDTRVAHFAEFRLHIHTSSFGNSSDFARNPDILFEGKSRSVEHD